MWRQVGPGGGGWLESVLVSGHDARRMFVGCDVAGVFVSEDAGRSYLNGTAGLEHFFIEAMVEHPIDPDFLLVGTLGGVYRSTDRGKTWQPCRKGFPPVNDYAHSCPIARILAVPGRPYSCGKPSHETDGGVCADLLFAGVRACVVKNNVFLRSASPGCRAFWYNIVRRAQQPPG